MRASSMGRACGFLLQRGQFYEPFALQIFGNHMDCLLGYEPLQAKFCGKMLFFCEFS